MGKFLFGIFVGAIVIGICCDLITEYPLGALYIMKNECEKSGDECVMIWEFVPFKKEKSE